MASRNELALTYERLTHLLGYDPETGLFISLTAMRGRSKGVICGTRGASGYISIRIDQRPYKAHRLAWFYVTGEWPPIEVDHINRHADDNRWTNLRLANELEQAWNRGMKCTNKSGCPGVFYHTQRNVWVAQIRIPGGKKKHLGCFGQGKDAAIAVYRQVERALHGEFSPLQA